MDGNSTEHLAAPADAHPHGISNEGFDDEGILRKPSPSASTSDYGSDVTTTEVNSSGLTNVGFIHEPDVTSPGQTRHDSTKTSTVVTVPRVDNCSDLSKSDDKDVNISPKSIVIVGSGDQHQDPVTKAETPPPKYEQVISASDLLTRKRSVSLFNRRTSSLTISVDGGDLTRSLDRPLVFCPRGSLREVVEGGLGLPPDFEDVVLKKEQSETLLTIFTQVLIPFLLAGLGMVGAGLVLSKVKNWEVFKAIPELMIMVPPLLGLKGNLEMTLASRISTQANLGKIDTRQAKLSLAAGNLSLIQCQAVVAGFVASVFAVIKDWASDGTFNLKHSLLLCASSLLTASIASVVLASVMLLVVIISQRLKINPDNIATPIAASLGDITTLALLAGVSTLFYTYLGDYAWVTPVVIAALTLMLPLWIYFSYRNAFTHEVLFHGWLPIILAIAISSTGGYIMEQTIERFAGLAAFQPVINGVGGNLVAVQASRISTYLHQIADLGDVPVNESICVSPCGVFFGKCPHSRTARILMLILIPGQILFALILEQVDEDAGDQGIYFYLLYITAALVQVYILLYSARILVYFIWSRKSDPDNATIPYLTAFGDLLGSGLLAAVFILLELIKQ